MTQTMTAPRVQTVVRGEVPAWTVDYARTKTAALAARVREPILFARVKLTQGRDPAVRRPALAQATLDVGGRPARAQAAAPTMREAVDLLLDRLQRRLAEADQRWEARRGATPHPGRPRQAGEPSHRPDHYPRPVDEREIVRHKSFALPWETPDEAAFEMDSMDYDFHLFTDSATGVDSVIYRAGPTSYRLAQAAPCREPGPFAVPLTVSAVPAPELSPAEAAARLESLGLPFVFFVDPASGRGNVLYHRYDGHYGLITPADGAAPMGADGTEGGGRAG
jgi:hypothetical protein